ncbi:MAG: PKD domain-containing protein [Ginsengibacter sp.]
MELSVSLFYCLEDLNKPRKEIKKKLTTQVPCKIHRSIILLAGAIILNFSASAQYTLNGSATQDNCHCYTLTQEVLFTSGSVWNNNKIDLTKSFTFTFNVYLGCIDVAGADGIAFVLQPISTSIGVSGSGLGFQGISPSLGVTLDTWQNASPDNDPVYDHIAIQSNGVLDHNTLNNLAGPVQISALQDNVEDCAWHILKISWNAPSHTYEVYFDNALRMSLVTDMVKDIFKGDPLVFWGFSGSTGGSVNVQKFCTTLDPVYAWSPDNNRCIGIPITFYDASLSFGPIVKRVWNFGDGSGPDSVDLNPVHSYASANDYKVSLSLTGADGCVEINTKNLRIGSKPVAEISVNKTCQENPVVFSDSSHVNVGTINSWYWDLGNGVTLFTKDPVTSYSDADSKTIRLAVKSLEGCTSDTVNKTIVINPRPVIGMTFSDACENSTVAFNGIDSSGVSLAGWNWNFGEGTTGSGITASHLFGSPGTYPIQLYAVATNGCISDTLEKILNIYSTNASAGNDLVAAAGQPIHLHATGGLFYLWSPATGLSDPEIADPVAVLASDQTYQLKAFTPLGCETFDTITIKIYKGPEIYVPSAFSPNHDGLNDVFKALPVGLISFKYLKIYNRWGEEMFSTTDSRIGWDGTYKGKLQAQGVYVWITSGTDYNGNSINRRGPVTLLK